MYYKVYPGSLKDVSVLSNMVEESHILGISSIKLVLDKGFYSQYNLDCMHNAGYSFLLPLPRTSKKLYKQIMKNRDVLESLNQLILLKRKPLYALEGSIDHCMWKKDKSSSFPLCYGLYLDPVRQYLEKNTFLTELLLAEQTLNTIDWSMYSNEQNRKEIWKEEAGKWSNYFIFEENTVKHTVTLERNTKTIQKKLQSFGILILLSSTKQDLSIMLEQYRQRNEVEKLFDSGKNELFSNPLIVHNSNTMKITLFILFLSIIVQTYLSCKMKTGKVDSKYSIQSVFFELHKLKKAIWKDKTCIINEITKEQRTLFQQLNITMRLKMSG